MATHKIYAGVKLRETRQRLGLTQKAFATKLGVSLPYLNQMENNHRPIATTVVLALAQEFGFDVAELSTADSERMVANLREALTDPIFTDPSLSWASTYLTKGLSPRKLKPQGSFSTSPEGIVDLDGSVWEWTMECYDGIEGGTSADRCPAFFVGGEHLAAMSYLIRDPARGGCAVGTPPAHLGMRLISDKAV